MSEVPNQLDKLQQKLADIQKRQESIQTELARIRDELQGINTEAGVGEKGAVKPEPGQKRTEKVKTDSASDGDKALQAKRPKSTSKDSLVRT